MSEVACLNSPVAPAPFQRLEKLPFEHIPHQSKLFLDFLNKTPAVLPFYPKIFESYAELKERVPQVLEHYETDREALAEALLDQNITWRASPATLANIEKLRRADSVAVVTGQQAGLFTGALYTIYKAISIIKVAECLRERGVSAVPVFWIASEDHDFAEIAQTFAQSGEGDLLELKIQAAEDEGLPVGKIHLNESINRAIEELFAELPKGEASVELLKLINEAYRGKGTLSDAFACMMSKLFGEYGLILLDPLDENLKKLAAPILGKAVERSPEITAALIARSRELESAGYHAQVLIEEDSFPLFWIDEEGRRKALRRAPGGKIQVKGERREFDAADLKLLAEREPERLSPNATLRGAVQDFLLPTVAYFGGAAEVAYWAQTTEVYRVLERPATPVFHRASVTLVDPKVRRTLLKYDLNAADFFTRPEELMPQIVEEFLASDTARVFAEVEEIINTQLNRLDRSLNPIDPTLSENLAKRRRKILYHIGALRTKFHYAELSRNEIVERRFETAFSALYPNNGLQERTLNISSFLAQYGENLISWLVGAIDPDAKEHQIIFI